MGRKVLSQGLSPPQQGRAGVVEGVVGVGIVGLPAVAAQGAVPADLLRRPVEQHGGVLRPGGRDLQTVIHRAEGGGRGSGLLRGRHGAVRQARRRALRQQEPRAGGGEHLAQGRQRAGVPQQQRRHHTGGAEGTGAQQPRKAAQGGSGGTGGAQHHGQVQLPRAAEVQHQPGQCPRARRQRGGLRRRKGQQQQRCQHGGRGKTRRRPARRDGAHPQQQQKPGAAAVLPGGGALRQQGGQQRRQAVQQHQRRHAQRPLAAAALEQVGQLGQSGGADGGHGPEPRAAVQPGGTQRRVGAEEQQGGGGVPQARLEIQAEERPQACAGHGGQPRPAHTGGGHRRQGPGRILSAGGGGRQQQGGGAAAHRGPGDAQGGLPHRREQMFHGIPPPFSVIVNGKRRGSRREMAKGFDFSLRGGGHSALVIRRRIW